MFFVLGWILFVLAVAWHIFSMKYQHMKRLNLNHYIVYLLLNDEIRTKHKNEFGKWIQQSNAKDAMELSLAAGWTTENMADQLSSTSALGAHAMLWNSEYAKELREKYNKQHNS